MRMQQRRIGPERGDYGKIQREKTEEGRFRMPDMQWISGNGS
jgi:hypothetical protein